MLLGLVKEVNYFLKILWSDPHSQLQAQKDVPRVGLEAILNTLEHPLLNKGEVKKKETASFKPQI